jgi:hypothetical protein
LQNFHDGLTGRRRSELAADISLEGLLSGLR